MVAFVVDNSVAVAWLYPAQATDYSEKLLELSSTGTLHTAFIWPAEFANATSVLVKRGILTDPLGNDMIALAGTLGLIVDRAPADAAALYQVSRTYRLSAYDAAYLELALRLGMPLATRDSELRRAAEQVNLFMA